MASSRWKRFAFFDKHTLNLPSPVLEDLQLDTTDRTSTIISMQITTASLPLNTKITQTEQYRRILTRAAAATAALVCHVVLTDGMFGASASETTQPQFSCPVNSNTLRLPKHLMDLY